jgi:hypothetical protein
VKRGDKGEKGREGYILCVFELRNRLGMRFGRGRRANWGDFNREHALRNRTRSRFEAKESGGGS